MANIDDLKAALIEAAADITNTIDRLECLTLIDDWYLCRTAVSSVQSNSISSYSIGGRTVTRANVQSFANMERELYARIQQYLYHRGIGLISLSGADEDA